MHTVLNITNQRAGQNKMQTVLKELNNIEKAFIERALAAAGRKNKKN